MLHDKFLDNSLEDWGISLIIVVGVILLIKLISIFNKRIIKVFTRKTKNRLDDIIYDAVESPVLFAIALAGIWFAIHRLSHSENFGNGLDGAYRILIVLNVTWFFARLINGLIEVYWEGLSAASPQDKRRDNKMMPVIKRTILVLVWIIGIIMALSNIGVNISALLGTLGIGGIAFALAAQDTIKNLFGAITIFTDKPFSIGDVVRIDSFEGTIIDVGARSTKMRNYDNRIITFPNYKIADASIVNISAEPTRRVVMKIGLTYDTTPDKMKEAIAILSEMPSKVKSVSSNNLVVNFSDFLDSSLVITFIYFIEKGGNIGKTISDVNFEILSSFNQTGLSFAYPTQTIVLDKPIAIDAMNVTDKSK